MSKGAKLPDFLIIGAAKAGTTALFRALSRHPQIFCPAEKEPRFFAFAGTIPRFTCPVGEESARTIVTEEAAYLSLFSACAPGSVAGEASAMYLSSPRAPEVAFRYVPQARLVAVLRHPVERAYSQWLHLRHEGKESLADFEAAWAAEDARMAKGWSYHWQYRSRGLYGRHLDRWLEFFPREQLLVLFYEDWLQRPKQTLECIFNYLGVDALPNPVVTRENVSSRRPRWPWLHYRMVENNALRRAAQRTLPLSVRDAITRTVAHINLKPGPKLDPTVRTRLAVVYHEDLRRVEALTQTDLSAWRT